VRAFGCMSAVTLEQNFEAYRTIKSGQKHGSGHVLSISMLTLPNRRNTDFHNV